MTRLQRPVEASPSTTHSSLKTACWIVLPCRRPAMGVGHVDLAVAGLEDRRVMDTGPARSDWRSTCRVHFQVVPSSSEIETASECRPLAVSL